MLTDIKAKTGSLYYVVHIVYVIVDSSCTEIVKHLSVASLLVFTVKSPFCMTAFLWETLILHLCKYLVGLLHQGVHC